LLGCSAAFLTSAFKGNGRRTRHFSSPPNEPRKIHRLFFCISLFLIAAEAEAGSWEAILARPQKTANENHLFSRATLAVSKIATFCQRLLIALMIHY
jgi:hypothetical protein